VQDTSLIEAIIGGREWAAGKTVNEKSDTQLVNDSPND